MSDYIKREDALNAFRRVYMIPGRGTSKEIYAKQIENTYKQIESIPCADVVDRESYESMERTVRKLIDAISKTEQKHGKWMGEYNGWEDDYWCSECKSQALYKEGGSHDQTLSKYCPNCGARMVTDDV